MTVKKMENLMSQIQCPLKKNALELGDQIALICDEGSSTYRRLDNAVDYCAKKISELGIVKGNRVCISGRVNFEYIVVLFSLWRIGAVSCLLSDKDTDIFLNGQIKKVQGKLLLSNLPRLTGSEKILVEKVSFHNLVSKDACDSVVFESDTVKYAFDQTATIIFTSGSSAEPKAVMHSFSNHYYSALGSNENILVAPGDRWLLSLPVYHVSGLSILFRCLFGGGSIVLPDESLDTSEIVEKHKVTHVSFVAAQLSRILKDVGLGNRLKGLKVILLGGSAVPEFLVTDAIRKSFPIYLSYGLTETASQVATTGLLKDKKDSKKLKILPYSEVCIVDDEIFVKGKTLFQGYLDGDVVQPGTDNNGWFHTKDSGEFDKSQFLAIRGRKDNMFISGGENIFPEEIENILLKNGLIKAAVVLDIPDEKYGARPIVFVKPEDGKILKKSVLIKHLSEYLPGFKIPDTFYLWPEKFSFSGLKVLQREFRSFIENGDLGKVIN